jgi:hypothetical protein
VSGFARHEPLVDRWTPARLSARLVRRARRLERDYVLDGFDRQRAMSLEPISRREVRQARRRELVVQYGRQTPEQRRQVRRQLAGQVRGRQTLGGHITGLLALAASAAGIRIRRGRRGDR